MTETLTLSEAAAWEVLRHVIDPEVGINIVDLGLVYRVDVEAGKVLVTMTLTTPGCPLHETIAEAVNTALVHSLDGIRAVTLDLVWEPRWSPSLITEEGLEALGWR